MKIPDDTDYDPGINDLLHDTQGNPIDSDYIDKVSHEVEVGYDGRSRADSN